MNDTIPAPMNRLTRFSDLAQYPAGWRFMPYQNEDYAAAALVDGCILAHDTGLGKTLAGYTWALLKLGYDKVHANPLTRSRRSIAIKGRVLFVAPGDLHGQFGDDGVKFYNVRPTPISSQADLGALLAKDDSNPQPRLANGFYITSYTQLTTNGVLKMPNPEAEQWKDPRALLEWLSLKIDPQVLGFFAARGALFKEEYERLGIVPSDRRKELDAGYRREMAIIDKMQDTKQHAAEKGRLDRAFEVLSNLVCEKFAPDYFDLSRGQHSWIIRACLKRYLKDCSQHAGDFAEYQLEPTVDYPANEPIFRDQLKDDAPPTGPTRQIKCVYSPSLADLCWDKFDAVIVDEGVRLQTYDSLVGMGVRQMAPRFRLVLTATPIKNRLPSIFWLLHWATGANHGPTPRWPYSCDPSEQGAFTHQFMLEEFNVTKCGKSKQTARYIKHRPEICSIHLLWKLLGPAVLRRHKEEAGIQLVKKIRQVCRVPMGLFQDKVYDYHMRAAYFDHNGLPAPGAQLQALRVASAAPHSELLRAQLGGDWSDCCRNPKPVNGLCRGCGSPISMFRSPHDFTPKMAMALGLIKDIMERGESVAIGSAFNDPSDTLAKYLKAAGVPHAVLDGRVNQKKRGAASKAFNQGQMPVTLAGVECMAEGHNWDRVNNVILLAYSWAADKFIQFINRIYRLTSKRDINIWVIICDKSADRVLEENINQKVNAAALAVDGALLTENPIEMTASKLLAEAIADYQEGQNAALPNEEILLEAWQKSGGLRDQLATAFSVWKCSHAGKDSPAIKPETPPSDPTSPAPAAFNLDTITFDFTVHAAAKPTTLPDE